MLTRPIPKSGEALPVIGLGTWQTFDVGTSAAERAPLKQVLQRFLDSGARLIDSSPMYGRAERVVGDVLASLADAPKPFLATKVWTTGRDAGLAQLETSVKDMGRGRMDLFQVHNLVDWRTHLPLLREWKAQGRVRYVGITHYARSAFDDLERLLREQTLDFIQLPYSLAERDAEKRLLPAAAEHGVAVLVMQPFATGQLFRQVKGRALPAWAADFDCASWAQFFLKFILGHPAVHCPLPATSNPEHVADNVRAGFGRLPDAKTRERMARVLDS
ncbi:aldo/keto reductase [Myxococcus llanfairpwllgwyngyllgogerychwyrndrobwllllantysiliogogogochensis]|uniref:Aldo/keto reductase n=2 Tax=Myxococcus llanfairpwllgwyngyllgogerychwyrndrobwllllantysiliogogogochensis TaxID=2590453 RepID=A0A540WXX5_9BACT|nr:aldo/keto reductase [Myxococcus llanfairpwllgwyngyllgogerychwyrndrobwllllantysiliogogogochensis]